MSDERTGVDRVLDWVVPVRLSGKRMSVEVERGVNIMLSLILLATVPYHAISKTLEVLPPDATDSVVWTKFSLYLLCDIVVYIGIITGVLLMKPYMLELIEIIEQFVNKKTEVSDKDPLIQEVVPMVTVEPTSVSLPISSDPVEGISEPESEIPTSLVQEPELQKINTYLSSAINEPALKAFIKANPNRFSSGEDMAIFYFLMTDKNYIRTSKKDFHTFISSLIDCVGYTQLSKACAKVKSILHDKWHDANEEMVNKYQDLWEDLRYLYSIKVETFRMRLHSLRISFP